MKYSRYLTVDLFWYFLLGGIIIVIDQASKYWAFSIGHAYYSNICVELLPVVNKGLAFSLLTSSRVYVYALLITAISFFLMLLASYAYWRYENGKVIFAETLVLAASISNLLDRLVYGGVLDFITINIVSMITFPVGNLADIFIVSGLLYMLYQTIAQWDEEIVEET